MSDNNDDAISVGEALEQVNASIIALKAAIQLCEECRQFMAVARLANKNNNPDLSNTILSVMIDRVDPFLQNLYKDIPDSEFVDTVKNKIESEAPWPAELVDFVEFDESLISDEEILPEGEKNDKK